MTDETLFSDALAIPDPADRAAFLAKACPDPVQRQRVEELLAAVGGANPLDRPPADLGKTGAYEPGTVDAEPTAAVGDRVGPYKLLEKIGEGGMGEVWVADQLEPIKRRVALKLIKPGMDSRSVLGRFEAERQALAVMDHPNIAKVLDAGTTPDGRPYFVMELVKGTPITEFCDARKLTPKQRLELFVPVCQAIQHAHMKGIIHRDIKPSNVLVALHDETPVPKVIDFGVAKAVGQQLTEKTVYTGFGALVGTPAYMAPEQATFNQLDVDTRADVYALGVLLYELLAGSPPIEKERLKRAALDEVLRIVRDEEPPRPSQRLSTSQAKAGIAASRQSDPARLSALMKGEIDWIVMKALEKDRTRRYDTANGLAKDVQRYLAGDAVEACPPTLGYRLKKAYRRNKAAVWVASAFLGVLSGAAALAAGLAVQARRAEQVAERNAEAFYGAMVKADDTLQQIELTALGQRIDADLAEAERNTTPHIGLLRLARTLKTIPTGAVHRRYQLEGGGEVVLQTSAESATAQARLREFLTAAILVAGQEFAPLVPPVTHDGHEVTRVEISPDGSRLLTLGADRTARLWEMRTGRPLATLRADREEVTDCGFSPDSRTVYTDDSEMDVRLWDVASGRCRVRLEPPSPRGVVPKADHVTRKVSLTDDRLMTHTLYYGLKYPDPSEPDLPVYRQVNRVKSAVELWDATTGRRIARLNRGRLDTEFFQFLGGRWIAAREGASTAVILSADDGRELARKRYENRQWLSEIACSRSRRHLVATIHDSQFSVWDTDTWIVHETVGLPSQWGALAVLDNGAVLTWDYRDGVSCGVVVDNPLVSPDPFKGRWSRFPCQDELALLETFPDGLKVIDTSSGKPLRPPAGRRYHPAVARFAPDGRFIDGIDAVTEKRIPTQRRWEPNPVVSSTTLRVGQATGALAGFGQVAVEMDYTASIRLLPAAEQLAVPADTLELWLQVCLCGEIGPDEEFVKWDEATWQRKRQQLAATPPLDLPVPFPGQVAADRTHWWWMTYLREDRRDIFALQELYQSIIQPILDGKRELDELGASQERRINVELDKFTPPTAPAPRRLPEPKK